MPYFNLKYIFSGGVLYDNVEMMNSKTQETLDQLDAHNSARSRVITRDLSDRKYNTEGMAHSG